MCFHKRFVFTRCGHSAWAENPFKICAVEEAFNRGMQNEGCESMWGHRYLAHKLDSKCEGCLIKHADIDGKRQTLKDSLAVLREMIHHINKSRKLATVELAEAGEDEQAKEDASQVKDWLESAGPKNPVPVSVPREEERRKVPRLCNPRPNPNRVDPASPVDFDKLYVYTV